MKKILFAVLAVLIMGIHGHAFYLYPQIGISLYSFNTGMVGLYSALYDLEGGLKFNSGNTNYLISDYFLNFQMKNEVIPTVFFTYGLGYSFVNGFDSLGQFEYNHEIDLLCGLQYRVLPKFIISARLAPVAFNTYKYSGVSPAVTTFVFNSYVDLGITYLF